MDSQKRLQQLERVLSIGQELTSTVALDPLLQRIATTAAELTRAKGASVLLVDTWTNRLHMVATTGDAGIQPTPGPVEDSFACTVLTSGQAIIVQDPHGEPPVERLSDPRARSLLVIPLQCQNRRIGVLKVFDCQGGPGFCQEDVEVLTVLSAQATVAIENARLFEAVVRQQEDLRSLATRLAEAEEIERQRLAREVHDLIGQDLTMLALALRIMETRLAAGESDQARNCLADALMLVEQTTRRARDIMGELHPSVLDDQGMMAALHWYGDRFASETGIPVTVEGQDPIPRLAMPVESALFRITQEALASLAQHTRVSEITVQMEADNGSIRLIVADRDGGDDPANSTAGIYEHQATEYATMAERAEAVGGRCTIEYHPHLGTRLIVEVARVS